MVVLLFVLCSILTFSTYDRFAFGELSAPSSMPTEHEKLMQAKYEEFMKSQRKKEKVGKEAKSAATDESQAFYKSSTFNRTQFLESLRETPEKIVEATPQVIIPPGTFWFGTQMSLGTANINDGKVIPLERKDGADLRKKVVITKPFTLDIHTVTRKQFAFFVEATGYVTEAEAFGWSFVLDRFIELCIFFFKEVLSFCNPFFSQSCNEGSSGYRGWKGNCTREECLWKSEKCPPLDGS